MREEWGRTKIMMTKLIQTRLTRTRRNILTGLSFEIVNPRTKFISKWPLIWLQAAIIHELKLFGSWCKFLLKLASWFGSCAKVTNELIIIFCLYYSLKSGSIKRTLCLKIQVKVMHSLELIKYLAECPVLYISKAKGAECFWIKAEVR